MAFVESWQIMTISGDRWVSLLLGTVSGALAMLGPGLMVDRCSPIWVEARASSASKKCSSIPVSRLPKQPNFLPRKRLLLASRGSAICPDVGLCANGAWWIIAFINGTKRLSFKIQANGIEQEIGVPGRRRHA